MTAADRLRALIARDREDAAAYADWQRHAAMQEEQEQALVVEQVGAWMGEGKRATVRPVWQITRGT